MPKFSSIFNLFLFYSFTAHLKQIKSHSPHGPIIQKSIHSKINSNGSICLNILRFQWLLTSTISKGMCIKWMLHLSARARDGKTRAHRSPRTGIQFQHVAKRKLNPPSSPTWLHILLHRLIFSFVYYMA